MPAPVEMMAIREESFIVKRIDKVYLEIAVDVLRCDGERTQLHGAILLGFIDAGGAFVIANIYSPDLLSCGIFRLWSMDFQNRPFIELRSINVDDITKISRRLN